MPDTLSRVADEVLGDAADLLARVLDEISEALPELARDPRIRGLLTTTVHDTVVAALRVLSTGSPAADAASPAAGLELARQLAQHDVPISVLLRAYRLGQAAFQQELIARIAARRVTADEVANAARRLSAVAFSFVDAVSEEIVAAYQAERDNWMRQRNAGRLAKVTAILASDAGTDDIGAALGYGTGGSHVGAVLWCGHDTVEGTRLATLERLVPRVAAALGTRSPLVVAPDASTLWAWFPAAAVRAAALEDVLAPAPPGTHLAVGDPARGLPGFRRTHQQAHRCHTVAVAADPAHRPRVSTPALVGPVALLAMDPAALAEWVQEQLGELATDDEPHARTRETVWAYLSTGGSLTAAAGAVGVHKNTVQYRIRRAEDDRGRPFADDRLAVEVALLACRLLGSAVLRPPG